MSELQYAIPMPENDSFGFCSKEQLDGLYNELMGQGKAMFAVFIKQVLLHDAALTQFIETGDDESILEEMSNLELEYSLANSLKYLLEKAQETTPKFGEVLAEFRSDRIKVDAICEYEQLQIAKAELRESLKH